MDGRGDGGRRPVVFLANALSIISDLPYNWFILTAVVNTSTPFTLNGYMVPHPGNLARAVKSSHKRNISYVQNIIFSPFSFTLYLFPYPRSLSRH